MKLFYFNLFVLFFSFSILNAQTGPGGVGNSDGSSGQPEMILWLDASNLSLSNGDFVTSWSDLSGNNNDLNQITGGRQPLFQAAGIGGKPSVLFDGNDLLIGPASNTLLNGTTEVLSAIVVFSTSSNNDSYISSLKRNGTGSSMFSVSVNRNSNSGLAGFLTRNEFNTGFVYLEHNNAYNNGNTRILSALVNNSSRNLFIDGVSRGNDTQGMVDDAGSYEFTLGAQYFGTRHFNGQIAEYILFKGALNNAQRTIVENYLQQKYNSTISINYFDDAVNYFTDFAGIGQELNGNVTTAKSSGFYVSENGSLDNGDYLMFAHNNTINDGPTTLDLPVGVAERWKRDWYVEKTGGLNAKMTFDFQEGITGGLFPQNISNYVLLFRSSTSVDYSVVSTSSVNYGEADQVIFDLTNINLQNGYYTIGTTDESNSPVLGKAGTTWYALVSGKWDDPNIWTLDPAGALPNNPGNTYPQLASDNVVIKTGKTITVDYIDINCSGLTVDGRLDIGLTSGHAFTEIKGNGRIIMAADNFPAGDATHFNSKGLGEGTVVYNGTGNKFTTNRTYCNLEIRTTNNTDVIQLEANYTLNGDLTIEKGGLKFGNTSTTVRSLNVNGNVNVNSTGYISVGTGNAFHSLDIKGDFTNYGNVKFTNRNPAYQNWYYTNTANNGVVNISFSSANSNQKVICNGPTYFYDITIDKGVDQTYVCEISANSTDNFRLLGQNNGSMSGSGGDRDGTKALRLLSGTAKLKGNIDIPVLAYEDAFEIDADARLWLDGGSASMPSTAEYVAIYGALQISGNSNYNDDTPGGIIMRENGAFKVEGGTVRIPNFRTSSTSGDHKGAYVQTGGYVTVFDEGYHSDYACFHLPYTSNVFMMSGGTLEIEGREDNEWGNAYDFALIINSEEGNYNVSGGTVILDMVQNESYKMTSRAPFYNFILRNSNVNALTLSVEAYNPWMSDLESVPALPLVVLNDLTLEATNSPTLAVGNNDVTVGGDFRINYGATYSRGNNTTTFNGTQDAVLYIGHPIDDSYELPFNNFVINKPADKRLLLDSDTQKEAGIASPDWHARIARVDGDFIINKGILDQGKHSIRLYGSITVKKEGKCGVYESGVTHKDALIMFKDDGNVINTEKGAEFGNIKLNAPNNRTLTLTSDIYIKRIAYHYGRINMGSYNLKIDYLHKDATLGLYPFDDGAAVSEMFYGTGKASDGGLSIYVPAGTPNGTEFAFPLGAETPASRYTPARMTVNNVTDDGYVTITAVDEVLKTTNQSGDILSYYWRVRHEGFTDLPTVDYKYYYHQSDEDGNGDNGFRPGKVLDESPYTRSEENNSNLNRAKNIITFDNNNSGGLLLEKANYTAGQNTRFTGDVHIFYTRDFAREANWNDNNTWTRNDDLIDLNGDGNITPDEYHDSRQPAVHPSGTGGNPYPQAGDIAVIGWIPWTDLNRDGNPANGTNGSDNTDLRGMPHGVWIDNTNEESAEVRFTQMTDAAGNPVARVFRSIFQFRPTLCINGNGELTTTLVRGEGMFWCRDADPDFSKMDIGEFAKEDSAYVVYENFSDPRTINNTPALFPNLMVANDNWGQNNYDLTFSKDIVTNGNFELMGNVNVLVNNGTNGDFNIGKNILMFEQNGVEAGNSGGGAELLFQNSGSSREITVNGDILIKSTGGTVGLRNANGGGLNHDLRVYGNIYQNSTSGGGLQLWSGSDNNDHATLYLQGENSTSFDVTSGAVSNLYRLVLDKGTGQNASASFNSQVNIKGAANNSVKAIELINGTLIVNHANNSWDLTSGGDNFKIPSTAMLRVDQGKVNAYGNNSGIFLDGKLFVNGGTVDMINGAGNGNNYIEYSTSGNASIEIASGNLWIGSQLRRLATTDEGILNYKQSDGELIVGVTDGGENNRAIFEILNLGSSFTHTGGDIYFANDLRTSKGIASFYYKPETSNIATGAGIVFGNANTLAGSEAFSIYAGKPLQNISIGSKNNPSLKLDVVPLTVNENITINSNATLNGNALDITVKGDFINSGAFNANLNTVYFEGSTDHKISGNTIFHNLVKRNSGAALTMDASTEITIQNSFELYSGTFDDGGNNVNVLGDIHNEITTLSSGLSQGIRMNGSDQQIMTGGGTYSRLFVENPAGVLIPTEAQSTTISDTLQLKKGVFNIGKNMLVLLKDAYIKEAAPFSENNMIQTNISFTDAGVKKFLPVISSATSFTFPMGSAGKYTPIKFDISNNGNETGYLRVKAANERHVSVQEDLENPDPEIVDFENVLQYYWTLDAGGITNFTAMATFDSYADDIKFTAPYDASDYITARLLDQTLGTWEKFDVADFNESTNELYFYFSNTNDDGIDGDYTAGVDGSSFNGAIPDQVPSFISKQIGNWTNQLTWDTYPVAGGVVPAGGPRGAIMYVDHRVTAPSNFIAAYKTNINASGVLNIGTTFGHRLGNVSGTGRLYMERGDMPAGVYDDFFSASGGTVEFGGATGYDVLSEVTSVNNLILSGSNERRLPNLNLQIMGDMTFSGADVINEHDQNIYLKCNLSFTSGSFDAGTGNSKFIFNGSASQLVDGSLTGLSDFHNLEIKNSSGVIINSGQIEVANNLFLSGGHFSTTNAQILTITNTSESVVTGGGTSSFVNGPLAKYVLNAGAFTFPVGNNSRYGRIGISNVSGSGVQTWAAEYFNGDPAVAGMSTTTGSITNISNNEYWKLTVPSGNPSTNITLYWDSNSGLPNDLSNPSADLKIAHWNGADWEVLSGTFNVNAGAKTITCNTAANLTSGTDHYFTFCT